MRASELAPKVAQNQWKKPKKALRTTLNSDMGIAVLQINRITTFAPRERSQKANIKISQLGI